MADKNEPDAPNSPEVDEELAELLESAVKDFGEKSENEEPEKAKEAAAKPTPPTTLFNEEYFRNTAAKFEQNMAALFSPGEAGAFSLEQLGENIQRLAEATTQPGGFESTPDNEFSSIIAETIRSLSDDAALGGDFSEESMREYFANLGDMSRFMNIGNSASEGDSDPGELMPFMQKMMQNLLSKDILYPALSCIVEKYPAWLEANKSKLSTSDFERYSKQHSVMKQVCTELEKEQPTDSEQVKTSRFENVLALMHQMQDCGQPPSELVSDVEELPRLPPGFSPDQCVLQ